MTRRFESATEIAEFWRGGGTTAVEPQDTLRSALHPSTFNVVCGVETATTNLSEHGLVNPLFHGTCAFGFPHEAIIVHLHRRARDFGTFLVFGSRIIEARDELLDDWLIGPSHAVTPAEPALTMSYDSVLEDAIPSERSHDEEMPELLALDRLRHRLSASYSDLGRITGVGRTTLFSWRNGEAQPRASTVQQFWRVVALVDALSNVLNGSELRAWMAAGSPSPLELLTDGRVDLVERQAERLVFEPSASGPKFAALGFEQGEPPKPKEAGAPRRSERRPTKGRRAQ